MTRQRIPTAAPASADADEPPASGRDPAECRLTLAISPEISHKIDAQWLNHRLAAALNIIAESVRRSVGHVDVVVVSDAQMIELNRRHAQEDHTTDVLSFDLSEENDAGLIEAEIVICADEAARRAPELGHSIERELLLYAVHGILHCAGFDDLNQADYQRMHAEEDRILQAIGVGATFAPRAAAVSSHTPASGEQLA